MRGEVTGEFGGGGLGLWTKGTNRRRGVLAQPPVLPALRLITLRLNPDMSTSCGMEQNET